MCGGSFFRSCFSSTLEEETDPKKYEVKAKDSQLYTREAAARASFLLYFTILWSCKIKTKAFEKASRFNKRAAFQLPRSLRDVS